MSRDASLRGGFLFCLAHHSLKSRTGDRVLAVKRDEGGKMTGAIVSSLT